MGLRFRLQKWYLDAVTEDGRTFLGYSVTIRWWLLSLRYFSYLTVDANARVHQYSCYRQVGRPVATDNKICWKAPGLDGTWLKSETGMHEKLLEQPQGVIDWHCMMPSAQALVHVAGHEPINGTGYVEWMEMTMLPWEMPIRQLHWGRFHSMEATVIWIRWVSETEPRTLVFHNGARYDHAMIDQQDVRFGEYRLALSDPTTIRTGRIGSTVLSGLGWQRKLIPSFVHRLHETKWRSRGSLHGAVRSAAGWAIHEIVDFG